MEVGPTKVLTKVNFRTVFKEVEQGEEVHVIGSSPGLGAWDPCGSLPLYSTEELFPGWASKEPLTVELREKVEYKYIVKCADGSLKSWEPYEGNRSFVASGTDMTIEDDDGFCRNLIPENQEDDGDDDFVQRIASMSSVMANKEYSERMQYVRELEEEVTISSHDTVLFIAFQLPVKVVRKPTGGWDVIQSNHSFLPLMQDVRKLRAQRILCVGWPGIHTTSKREQEEIEMLLREYDCVPVFPPRDTFEKFLKFCTAFLWPVFHDVMTFFTTTLDPRPFDEEGWAAYQHVNIEFANTVVPNAHDSDLIWIHDYHLMMMPTFVSRKLNKANISLYLHTPFPSSDSFKALPVREELLSGLMCADLLGFQFFAYARNFLTTCKRILGLEPTYKAGGMMCLEYNGREIMLKVSHFYYPYQATGKVVLSDTVKEKASQVSQFFEGKTIFACMDRCDGLSGLPPKFRAFKRFLDTNPKFKGKAVLVQYLYESAGYAEVAEFINALRGQVTAVIKQDGKKFVIAEKGGDPDVGIYLRVEKMEREDRLGLFRAADVLLDTTVKAGLNLMPFEFVTAHADIMDKNPGVTIVSEFSGCSRVLQGSLRRNPWNTAEVANACLQAATMGDKEKIELASFNIGYMEEHPPLTWFQDFVSDIRRARKKSYMRYENIGFGAKIRSIAVNEMFLKLPLDGVSQNYYYAGKRVFLLDNEGTLAADRRHLERVYGAQKGDSDLRSKGTPPDEQVLNCLRQLAADPRNIVVILSGRQKELLEEWFGSVPRIGLCAEHGFYYKLPMFGSDGWHCMVNNPDSSWKEYADNIMRQFQARTAGSRIENKGSALVWNYRDADQHFGSWQAKELSVHLKDLLFGFDVDVITGKGYVEVKLRNINKGVAVAKVMSKVGRFSQEPEFILCIGDDRSDEDMFHVLNSLAESEEVSGLLIDSSSQLSTTDGGSDEPAERGLRKTALGQPSLSAPPGQLDRLRGSSSRATFAMGASFADGLAGLGGPSMSCDDDLRRDSKGGSTVRYYTCTVGRKPSSAHYYVNDVEEVSELLNMLVAQSKRGK
mmetsp:Transcript_11919/g.27814  ORF Transcript_11919/g.27814 Transcript_11919/m.27814 type:complete len:1054 (+) Transcript_11919:71-3232(+)